MSRTFIIAVSLGSVASFMDGTEQPAAGTGTSSDMSKVTLDGSATGAVCLDGSDPAYYIREGTGAGANSWYIHHEGGGWCEGYADCVSRSKTNLGSSKKYPATISQNGGYFSTDAKTNPLMCVARCHAPGLYCLRDPCSCALPS